MRALAVSADGSEALSGSFDSSAIRWSLARNAAEQVLRFHDDAVNAVALLRDGRAVTGGRRRPHRDLARRQARSPTAVLRRAYRADRRARGFARRRVLASAAWDNTVRLWPLAGGSPRVLEGHTQNVNGVAFTPDGKAVVSAAYDLTLRIWPLDGARADHRHAAGAALARSRSRRDGEIVAAGANGVVYFLDRGGRARQARCRPRRRR